ncbi:hypothetical protein BXZ70DRAFT_737484 [Cristinia sonorae]|uniref:F-box domain-containing protein n=1 Tax=Cristinia sonorae TaxID=1940300 RepID=A0A8K0UUP2_9AGAR|nr:hypothetical protein BXZ70DRAFT_737484 [Cristinia sonorae]
MGLKALLPLHFHSYFVTATPSPLATLPAELLTIIFQWLKLLSADQWTRVTHVCSYWRQVALNMQLLWQDITLTASHPDALLEMIRRAGELPLRLSLSIPRSFEGDLCAIIHSYINRIEQLELDYNNFRWTRPPEPTSHPVRSILRKLRLSDREDPYSSLAPHPILEFNFELPVLETLQIEGCVVSHNIFHLLQPTVKHLSMVAYPSLMRIFRGIPSLGLHGVSGMQGLETLVLKSRPRTGSTPDVDGLTMHFPFLRRLEMHEWDSAVAMTLEHLAFPSSTCIVIKSFGDELSERLSNAIMTKICGIRPLEEPTAIPRLHTVQIRTALQPDQTNLSCATIWVPGVDYDPESHSPFEPPIPTAEPRCSVTPGFNDNSKLLFSLCASSVYPVKSIQTLIISRTTPGPGPHLDWDDPDEDSTSLFMQGSFRYISSLESLYLEGIVWYELGYRTRLVLPRLQVLSLSGISFGEGYHPPYSDEDITVLEWLLRMLARRKEAVSPITKLIISKAEDFTQEDAALMQDAVDEFLWDGIVERSEEARDLASVSDRNRSWLALMFLITLLLQFLLTVF